MAKRTVPFGYVMKDGIMETEPGSKECVSWIFSAYAGGASMKQISEALNSPGKTAYDKDKPWNKSTVNRILQDQRYCGDAIYPEIIPETLFETVQKQRTARITVPELTETQKALRDLCDVAPEQDLTDLLLAMLNRLIADPDLIQCPEPEKPVQTDLFQIRRELESAMDQQPMDEKLVSHLILREAEAKYTLLGNDGYETEHLRRIISAWEPMEQLSAELLRQTVSGISIEVKKVRVRLKNNQVIEASECYE